MRKIFFKFLKISILWPFTFYSDPAISYCGNKLVKTSDELVTGSGYFCAFSIDFLYPWCIEANETWF
jgi:hypothetical protein